VNDQKIRNSYTVLVGKANEKTAYEIYVSLKGCSSGVGQAAFGYTVFCHPLMYD
jgi:hypothetical protein